MNRRNFLSGLFGASAALVLPWEPERIYSFVRRPGLQEQLDRFGYLHGEAAELDGTLIIRPNQYVSNCSFVAAPNFRGGEVVRMNGGVLLATHLDAAGNADICVRNVRIPGIVSSCYFEGARGYAMYVDPA